MENRNQKNKKWKWENLSNVLKGKRDWIAKQKEIARELKTACKKEVGRFLNTISSFFFSSFSSSKHKYLALLANDFTQKAGLSLFFFCWILKFISIFYSSIIKMGFEKLITLFSNFFFSKSRDFLSPFEIFFVGSSWHWLGCILYSSAIYKSF